MTQDTFQLLKVSLVLKEPSMKEILSVVERIGENNIFLAGGVIRSFVTENKIDSKDIDIFISKNSSSEFFDLIKNKGKLVPNQFGNTRWFPDANREFYYDLIIIENFFNGLWKCEDITDVLNQFDFTANAMAVDLKSGVFYNPSNGFRHAKEKQLRAIRFDFPEIDVSNEIPISRNSVLWFRYKHYAYKLGYSIEPITNKWILDNGYRIKDKDLFTKFFFEPYNC